MAEVDKRNRLDEEIFSFRLTKDERVMIYWYDKHVKTLTGSAAQKFLQKINALEGKENYCVAVTFHKTIEHHLYAGV